jgi:hypothetical protein
MSQNDETKPLMKTTIRNGIAIKVEQEPHAADDDRTESESESSLPVPRTELASATNDVIRSISPMSNDRSTPSEPAVGSSAVVKKPGELSFAMMEVMSALSSS